MSVFMRLRSSGGGGGGTGLNHGDTFTVTGSSLGTKSTVAPLVWDNCTAASLVAAGWSGGLPNAASNSNHNLAYRVAQNSVPLLHSRNGSKYLAGMHPQQGFYTGGNVMTFKTFSTPSFPYIMYFSWYQQFDPNWDPTLNIVPDGTNMKLWDYSIGVEPYDLPHNWYWEYNFMPSDKTSTTTPHVNDDDYPNNLRNDSGSWWGSDIPNPYDAAWTRWDLEVKFSTADLGGYIKAWRNGSLVQNLTTKTDGMSDANRCIGIGGYTRNTGGTNSQWRYFQDLYTDFTAARVIFGNATTLSASTTLANQIPQSWSATAINVTVNLGTFSNGATAYAHVVDTGGTVHDNVMGALTLGS